MPGFKTATKDGVQQTGFVFAKDASSQEVKKIATSADFQVGLSNLPKDLTVTGKATFTQGISGSLTRLADNTSYLAAGSNITITSASNGQVTITGATRAPVDATYIVFSSNDTLTSERIITAGSGITITDGGAGGSLTIAATGGGTGDVVGPASATDNAIARFNLTTGKLIQNSVTTVADTTGNITTLDAELGSLSGFVGTYAMFGHATQTALGQYAIVQKNDGETWLNSISDRYIRFTTDGNPSYDGYIGYSTLGSSTQISLTGRSGSPAYVTIGNTTGAGSTTIESGTGGIILTGEVSTSGDITIGGNDIKASNGNTNITLTSNTLTTFAGSIRINGNSIQASNGSTNMTLTTNTLTTFAGDVRINGNDIQSSSGINAISMSGNNVTVAGDLTVSGGKITLTNGSTIDSETLDILKLTESDVRIIGSTLSTDQTTFNLINTTATTLNVGGAATSVNVGASSALAIIGEAELGELPFTKVSFPGAFAFFSHKTLDNTVNGNYALVQSYDGYTYVNSPTTITFQYAGSSISGGTIGTLDNNTVSFTGLTGTATTLTLGNTAGASSATIDAGTGDINIGPSNSTRTINIGTTSTAANTIKLLPGTTAALGTVEIAQKSTFYNKVRICDDEAATGHEVYVNTGNNGAIASPITTPGNYSVTKIGTLNAESRVTLGSTNTTSITTIQAGTNGVILTTGAAGTGNISIGNSTETYNINIGIQANNTAGQQQTINVGHYSATGGSKNVNIRGDIIKLADTGGYVEFCGGYGSTGVTVSAAGNIETNGTLTVDSTSILTGNVTFGGNIVADANENKSIFTTVTSNTITIGGSSSTLAAAGALTVGGGYGSAGVSISANGVIEADGNLTVDGTAINIGTTGVIRTINVGTGAAVQTINLGTSATANIISVGGNAAQSVGINGGSVLNLLTNAGTTTIDSGGVSSTGIINIGIFGYAQTISIGNTTGATSLLLQAGTGNIALSGGNSTTYTIGTSSTTGTITVGQSTDTNTINIGNGATASTKTQTINVGNSTASNGITNINIGAASNGTNTITIGKFGSGLVNVILGGDDVQIGDNANSDIGFFGTTPQPKTSVTDITNNVTSGGTANTLSNYTSLTTYSTDAAAIRNNFYQIGVKLNAIIDALQSYGLI